MLIPGPAQVQAPGGTGGSVPAGGTTGQLLAKLSNANQDAGWVDPGLASNATPAAASGLGSPGVGTSYSRDDHVHPGSAAGVALFDAIPVLTRTTPVAGDVYTAGAYSPSGQSMFHRGMAYPFRIGATGSYKLGVIISGAGSAGALIRVGAWNDDDDGMHPGTVAGDAGTIDGTLTGLQYAPSTIALQSGHRYWCYIGEQGSPVTSPSLSVQTGPFLNYTFSFYSNLPATQITYTLAGALPNNPGAFNLNSNALHLLVFQAQ